MGKRSKHRKMTGLLQNAVLICLITKLAQKVVAPSLPSENLCQKHVQLPSFHRRPTSKQDAAKLLKNNLEL